MYKLLASISKLIPFSMTILHLLNTPDTTLPCASLENCYATQGCVHDDVTHLIIMLIDIPWAVMKVRERYREDIECGKTDPGIIEVFGII